MARPHKDPSKLKKKNVKVTEADHAVLINFLHHQRPNWVDVNEVGDVIHVILKEWKEGHILGYIAEKKKEKEHKEG